MIEGGSPFHVGVDEGIDPERVEGDVRWSWKDPPFVKRGSPLHRERVEGDVRWLWEDPSFMKMGSPLHPERVEDESGKIRGSIIKNG